MSTEDGGDTDPGSSHGERVKGKGSPFLSGFSPAAFFSVRGAMASRIRPFPRDVPGAKNGRKTQTAAEDASGGGRHDQQHGP